MIIRAVRDCPSGALSYAVDGVEARGQVDFAGERERSVEVSKDGPYRVTGGIPLVAGSGDDEPRNDGASREHYALCRCGQSQNKPFCSGMHWYVDFTDPVPDPERTPTIFEWAGGLPALTRMTRRFYEKYVPNDPMLAPIFANMSADHPQRVAKRSTCGPTTTSANTRLPSSPDCATAACHATAPGRRSGSTSSNGGSTPARPPDRSTARPLDRAIAVRARGVVAGARSAAQAGRRTR